MMQTSTISSATIDEPTPRAREHPLLPGRKGYNNWVLDRREDT